MGRRFFSRALNNSRKQIDKEVNEQQGMFSLPVAYWQSFTEVEAFCAVVVPPGQDRHSVARNFGWQVPMGHIKQFTIPDSSSIVYSPGSQISGQKQISFHCRAIKNKNRNHLITKVKNLGQNRRLIYKQPRQDLGLCEFSFARYLEKFFNQIQFIELCM